MFKGVICCFGVVGIIFGVSYGGIILNGVLSAKKADVERNVYENTNSYNRGKIMELVKLRLEYMRADEAGKRAIASVVRIQMADFDKNKLSDELYSFVEEIKYK